MLYECYGQVVTVEFSTTDTEYLSPHLSSQFFTRKQESIDWVKLREYEASELLNVGDKLLLVDKVVLVKEIVRDLERDVTLIRTDFIIRTETKGMSEEEAYAESLRVWREKTFPGCLRRWWGRIWKERG